MFELGFFELFLFGAIALIVLGPEKLPRAARMAGAWYGRIRRQIGSIQQEIDKEIHLMEAKQKLEEEIAKINAIETTIKQEINTANQALNEYAGSFDAIRNDEFGQPYYFLLSKSEQVRLTPPAPFLPRHDLNYE